MRAELHCPIAHLAELTLVAGLQVLAVDLIRIQYTPSTTILCTQLRRLALSYPSNIADLSTFLQHAELPLIEDLALAVNYIEGDTT
jgi:hypothetical protein